MLQLSTNIENTCMITQENKACFNRKYLSHRPGPLVVRLVASSGPKSLNLKKAQDEKTNDRIKNKDK